MAPQSAVRVAVARPVPAVDDAPVPDPLPILPIDRLRGLLLPAGRPGLDKGPRPTAWSVREVEAELTRTAQGLCLPEERWRLVHGVVWCWHDHLERAWTGLVGLGPAADPLRLVILRRQGAADQCRRLLTSLADYPMGERLVPIAAAEGLAGPLVDERGFRAGTFLARCLAPAPDEIPALERLQAAEILGLLQEAVTGPWAR